MNKRIPYDTKWLRDEPGEDAKTIDIPKERLGLSDIVMNQDNWRPWLKVKIEGLNLEGITHLFISLSEIDEIEERKSRSKKSLREAIREMEEVSESIIEEMERSPGLLRKRIKAIIDELPGSPKKSTGKVK